MTEPTNLVEEPGWLRDRIDQRLAILEPFDNPILHTAELIMLTTLTEPDEDATSTERDQWERTCDRCGRYCPHPIAFYTGTSTRISHGIQIIVTFGVCEHCRGLG